MTDKILEGTYEHKTRRQMIESNVEEEHSVSHVVAANNKEGWHSDVSGATGPVENFPIVPIKKNVELAIKMDKKWTGIRKEPNRNDTYEKMKWNTASSVQIHAPYKYGTCDDQTTV